MSTFSRLIGMASKALDKTGSSSAAGSAGGAGDWRSMVRSAADALTGDGRPPQSEASPAPGGYAPPPAAAQARYAPPPAAAASLAPADRQAIARYDYLLQTADPHQVEQIHREAFARLTPEQRAHVQARMDAELPPHERPRSADAGDLARAAGRAEAARPGMLRGLLARVGGGRGGSGVGRMAGGAALGAAGGVLAAVAGGAIVSGIAASLLAQAADLGVDFDALAGGLDVEGLADDALSGVGEQVSGFGEQIGGFDLPGLGDLFGR